MPFNLAHVFNTIPDIKLMSDVAEYYHDLVPEALHRLQVDCDALLGWVKRATTVTSSGKNSNGDSSIGSGSCGSSVLMPSWHRKP